MNRLDRLIEAYTILETPLGAMALGARGQSLRGVILPRPGETRPIDGLAAQVWPEATPNRRILPELIVQVREYWRGRFGEAFRVLLDLEGFPGFYTRVWRATMQIRPGEVRTYGELAREVSSPKACRAVGGAMAANPFPLIVPCHRVVAASAIGGFSAPGGVSLKAKLLEMERSWVGAGMGGSSKMQRREAREGFVGSRR